MNNPRHDKKTRAIYDNKDKLISVYKENPNEVYADWYFKEHYSDDRKWSVRIFKDFVLRNNISSIVDMGCGIGSYIEGALEGGVKIVKGYELCLENSSKFMSDNVKKFVEHQDVTLPIDCCVKYDCVLSIEVAEHILPDRSECFVENMANLSNRLIVFTAAPMEQLGIGHINCRPKEFWISQLEDHGYELDEKLVEETTKQWVNLGAPDYLTNNLMVFKK
jgi:cyclopropane fatty-acyl-phospholipid synthase-like methyltransferase